MPNGRDAPRPLRMGCPIEWSPPTDNGITPACRDAAIESLDVGMAVRQAEPAPHGHVADVGNLQRRPSAQAAARARRARCVRPRARPWGPAERRTCSSRPGPSARRSAPRPARRNRRGAGLRPERRTEKVAGSANGHLRRSGEVNTASATALKAAIMNVAALASAYLRRSASSFSGSTMTPPSACLSVRSAMRRIVLPESARLV